MPVTRIAFASDHVGLALKIALAHWAKRHGHAVEDYGTNSAGRVDYPDYATRAVRSLINDDCDVAVLVCGSGVGMAMAANRFSHARAFVGHDVAEVAIARGHNDANALCLGSRVTPESVAIEMLDAFLTTAYDGGRHTRRVAQLTSLSDVLPASLAIEFAPGPTSIENTVLSALAKPMLHHKCAEFGAMVDTVTARLRRMTCLAAGHVLLTSAAGTGVLESAFWNLCADDDHVVVLTNGYFGDRIVAIAQARGLSVRVLESAWTDSLPINELAGCLNEKAAAVFMVHLESSTGQINDIRAVAEITRRHGVPLVVDAVSSLGALPLSFDDDGFDVLVSSTQKGLGAPPGIGIVTFTDEIWQKASHPRSLYFSWPRAVKAAARNPTEMLWTPPIPLLAALHAASDRWQLDAVGVRQAERRRRILTGMRALGFESYLTEPLLRAESPVHAFRPPPYTTATEFRHTMARAGWYVAGGLGKLGDEIVRVASFYPDDRDERRLAAFLRDAEQCTDNPQGARNLVR